MTQPLLPAPVQSVVDWLREGYPDGVPQHDYIPLFALLARRLPAEQVQQVVDRLRAEGTLPSDDAEIGEMITRVTAEPPRENDIERIRARLGDPDPRSTEPWR